MEQKVKYYIAVIRKEKHCLECNSSFLGVEGKIFCTRKCGSRNRSKKLLGQTHIIVCAHCRAKFSTQHKRSYCNKVCANAANNRRKHTGPHIKQCQVCNKNFMAKGEDKKNCSIECYSKAEKARYVRTRYHMNISKVEKVDKIIVFNTHQWHCAMCGTHTPESLMGSFLPNEPTLDHIIPLSKGGSHTYSNVQLLCRRCNCSVKKDKIPYQGASKSQKGLVPETEGHPEFSGRNV